VSCTTHDPNRRPETGTRSRTRDIGYGNGMLELFALAEDLRRGPLPADEALELLRTYAYSAWAIHAWEGAALRDVAIVGRWDTSGREH
jgi:hypothetical protein